MEYDCTLEAQLCPGPIGGKLLDRLYGYRERVQVNRLERVVSTRFIKEAYEMVSRYGWTQKQVDAKLFSGWRDDEVAKVKGGAA